ncbi:MAG: hypothetical protein ACQESB_00550 [Elusimicrobiota bacterium]
MPKKEKELRAVVVCCPQCSKSFFTGRILQVLENNFKSCFRLVENEAALNAAYFSLMPDMVFLDPDCEEIIESLKNKKGYMSTLAQKPFFVLSFPHTDQIDSCILPIEVEDVINSVATAGQIMEKIARTAGKLGFNVASGKVMERLVKIPVSVSISSELLNHKITGYTTGINKEGMGARIKAENLSLSDFKKLEGSKCRIEFEDNAFCFFPVDATILRVEESYDVSCGAFIAAAFNGDAGYGLDGASTAIIEQLINSQKDDSILKRAWRKSSEPKEPGI